jgi:hypothetical protein
MIIKKVGGWFHPAPVPVAHGDFFSLGLLASSVVEGLRYNGLSLSGVEDWERLGATWTGVSQLSFTFGQYSWTWANSVDKTEFLGLNCRKVYASLNHPRYILTRPSRVLGNEFDHDLVDFLEFCSFVCWLDGSVLNEIGRGKGKHGITSCQSMPLCTVGRNDSSHSRCELVATSPHRWLDLVNGIENRKPCCYRAARRLDVKRDRRTAIQVLEIEHFRNDLRNHLVFNFAAKHNFAVLK